MKDYLYEVVPIRIFLIVTLVFYHAFAIFSGAWKPIVGYPDIPLYSFLDKLSYACLLETFVFISGYILGYQVRIKGLSTLSSKSVFLKKAKRLIVPSILFSVIYIILLGDITMPIIYNIYNIINGAGHMWFLPMLYWCFIEIYILEKLDITNNIKLLLLLFLIPFSVLPLPFQLGNSFYYLFFFYIGYYIQRNDYKLKLNNVQFAFIAICFISLFLAKITFDYQIDSNNYIFSRIILLCHILLRFTTAFLGIIILMSLSMRIINKNIINWNYFLYLSDCCFGVYLFQQFVLLVIYKKTEIPYFLNPYSLPWVSFFISLVISILFTVTLRKTKLGKQIL